MDWFSFALRLKSLWLVLNGESYWSLIIKHKYLKDKSIAKWLRVQVFNIHGTSYIWNGFLRALSWITRCLGWKTRNSQSIKNRVHPIVGLSNDYVLPEDLRIYLAYYGITSMEDAHTGDLGSYT